MSETMWMRLGAALAILAFLQAVAIGLLIVLVSR